MNSAHVPRILAVDPGTQYLGVAVLEGEEILWYRVKTFQSTESPSLRAEVKTCLTDVIRAYHPGVLAIEEPFYLPGLRSPALRDLTAELKTWARWQGFKVCGYTPPEVKAFFCRGQKTKESLAEAMIGYYPFLRRYLTYLPWRKRYWFHVFDAVGLGLMCYRKLNLRGLPLNTR
jgi:Holliday junction resolvasome RuvABC endonuclease subunit